MFLVFKDLTKGDRFLKDIGHSHLNFKHKINRMVAKRALNFGTPRAKRARYEAPMVIYRGVKPEMKYFDVNPTYELETELTLTLNGVSQGTATNNRIGAKIKIWRVEYTLSQPSSSNSVRIDLLINNNVGATLTHTYSFLEDRKVVSLLKRTYHHSGTANGPKGMYASCKLPMGVVSKFGGAAGTTINSNQIAARILTPATETIVGTFRIWYTDA